MRDAYDIYIGGEAKSLKAALGFLFMERVPEERLIPVVRGLIQYFQDHGKKKEKFSKFIERVTADTLHEAVAG